MLKQTHIVWLLLLLVVFAVGIGLTVPREPASDTVRLAQAPPPMPPPCPPLCPKDPPQQPAD